MAPPVGRRSGSTVALLDGDLLLQVFSVGDVGHLALCRCSAVCRSWKETCRQAQLWVPLLRHLLGCMGSDPFRCSRSHCAGESWCQLFRLVYRYLHGVQSSARVQQRTRLTPRTNNLWDVICSLSPLDTYLDQREKRRTARGAGLHFSKPVQLCPPVHCSSWEYWDVAARAWVLLVPPNEPLTPALATVNLALDWLICQQHDPLGPDLRGATALGSLLCGYHSATQKPTRLDHGSVESLRLRGFCVGPTKEWARHSLAVAEDCFLGLHPTQAADAAALSALRHWRNCKFRLHMPPPPVPPTPPPPPLMSSSAAVSLAASSSTTTFTSDASKLGGGHQPNTVVITSAPPPICDWAPLAFDRFGERRFEAEGGCQTVEAWRHHAPPHLRALGAAETTTGTGQRSTRGARTIFLQPLAIQTQSVSSTANLREMMAMDAPRTAAVARFLGAWCAHQICR